MCLRCGREKHDDDAGHEDGRVGERIGVACMNLLAPLSTSPGLSPSLSYIYKCT